LSSLVDDQGERRRFRIAKITGDHNVATQIAGSATWSGEYFRRLAQMLDSDSLISHLSDRVAKRTS
jgi:hypothetical protein